MTFQNTISGKEFCKKNCGNLSKEKFYEEYYRIIHTAYLRSNGNPCIDVIRTDFQNSFGITPDNISISYIYATTKYLVYDVVVSALLSDGRIDSQYYYGKLAIDLGFDVWLIKSIESEVRLTMNDFLGWQPLPKNDRTERQVYDFWHFKLPKSHNFGHLYSAIIPYKKLIFETYYKLLKANSDFENDEKCVHVILEYLTKELAKYPSEQTGDADETAVTKTAEESTKAAETVETASETVSEPVTFEAAEAVSEPVAFEAEEAVSEPMPSEAAEAVSEPVPSEAAEAVTEPVVSEAAEKSLYDEETLKLAEEMTEPAVAPVMADEDLARAIEETDTADDLLLFEDLSTDPDEKTEKSAAVRENKYVASSKEDDPVRKVTNAVKRQIKGFTNGEIKITKDKLITAAVCVALAGTMLVPLALALGRKHKKRR